MKIAIIVVNKYEILEKIEKDENEKFITQPRKMCSGQLDHLHEHGGPANVYLIRWSQTTHLLILLRS